MELIVLLLNTLKRLYLTYYLQKRILQKNDLTAKSEALIDAINAIIAYLSKDENFQDKEIISAINCECAEIFSHSELSALCLSITKKALENQNTLGDIQENLLKHSEQLGVYVASEPLVKIKHDERENNITGLLIAENGDVSIMISRDEGFTFERSMSDPNMVCTGNNEFVISFIDINKVIPIDDLESALDAQLSGIVDSIEGKEVDIAEVKTQKPKSLAQYKTVMDETLWKQIISEHFKKIEPKIYTQLGKIVLQHQLFRQGLSDDPFAIYDLLQILTPKKQAEDGVNPLEMIRNIMGVASIGEAPEEVVVKRCQFKSTFCFDAATLRQMLFELRLWGHLRNDKGASSPSRLKAKDEPSTGGGVGKASEMTNGF